MKYRSGRGQLRTVSPALTVTDRSPGTPGARADELVRTHSWANQGDCWHSVDCGKAERLGADPGPSVGGSGVRERRNQPSRPTVTASQAASVPDVRNDGSGSVDSCDRLRAHFVEQQPALLRGAYRSAVADVNAWRLGGRFPEAVPQFLAARPGYALVYVCFFDMDIAKAPPPAVGDRGEIVTAPSHNRAVWLVDASSGETWMLTSGFHDTAGWKDLPVEPVS